MKLTLTSYSTALFSSWHFIEELNLLFDCGDGLTALLGSKSRKVQHAFISHADRDHVSGLLQFMQLNGRPQGLSVYYPKDCGTFPNLQQFSRAFDPHVQQADWIPLAAGQEVRIGKDLLVQTIRNGHVPAPADKSKSFSFMVQRLRQKLRPEFAGLDSAAIAALRREKGDAAVMKEIRDAVFAYSGDTPVDDLRRWDGVHTLLHEATFIDSNDMDTDNPRKNKHSTLAQVMAMVAQTDVKHLILGHFSSRYSDEQIVEAVNEAKSNYKITIPVDLILPGKVNRIVSGN